MARDENCEAIVAQKREQTGAKTEVHDDRAQSCE